MRAALYARVSSEEQVEGYSLDAQRRAFQTLVEARGWTIYKEYLEEGKSARTENINKRPVFREATADGLDRKYDILVVHKVDRFSRKLRITLEYFDKLGKADVGFVSIVEQMDFSTPWGKFTLSMLAPRMSKTHQDIETISMSLVTGGRIEQVPMLLSHGRTINSTPTYFC